MSNLINKLNMKGGIPSVKASGITKKDERPGQFSRCECGGCRCCVDM